MKTSQITTIEEKLRSKHSGDEKQLEVIFSPISRILVEAAAGYGKTNTMVSKIAYLIATNKISNPKKLLALTFSVNAAYKIKKDVIQNIPVLLSELGIEIDIKDKLLVSNYHGFARRLLKKFGYLFHANLLNIDNFQSIDDGDQAATQQAIKTLSYADAEFLSNYTQAAKKVNFNFLKENLIKYNEIIITKLLPANIITFNAILTLAIMLMKDYTEVRTFYQLYFSTILVDEFQDTNLLSYWLLRSLFTDKSRIILFGDSLQRIYGFIGAVPDLLNKSIQHLSLNKIQLSKNYRFRNNHEMLLLDRNIRKNAENPGQPDITETANIDFSLFSTQDDEADYIIQKSLELSKNTPASRVAILVKQRGNNINKIIEHFDNCKIAFFYGLFSDEDPKYIQFNKECLFEFMELLKAKGQISKQLLSALIRNISSKQNGVQDPLINSLLKLLEIFVAKINTDYSFLASEDKVALIKETFEHNGLKQYVEFVESKIIISTVHSAKGLEWDYVILPDMEAYSFPNYWGLCSFCNSRQTCELKLTADIESKFLEELSVFYVAVTRAKQQVFFTASEKQITANNFEVKRNLSCFMRLPGISID